MRVFGRALVLGFIVVVCAPTGVSAAPIVADKTANPDGCGALAPVTPADRCNLFEIDPFSGETLTIDFFYLQDVALFQFDLDGATTLSVTTDPFWEDPVGPYYGIFNAASLSVATV